MSESFSRRIVAEFLGTAILLATIVGSGIMSAKLSDGNIAIALLGNTIPTGAILVVLILVFGPISGAHFNPVVSAAFALRRQLSLRDLLSFTICQILGAIIGVWAAHGMFDLAILQTSSTIRTGQAQWLAETIATFGLILTIFGCVASAQKMVPFAVGLYITAAYWFTASTSFANPAVTIARSLTDTFAGIAPANVITFIIAQTIGAAMGVLVSSYLWQTSVIGVQK
jgi:glycerol uptake facilitator-like aquaporin